MNAHSFFREPGWLQQTDCGRSCRVYNVILLNGRRLPTGFTGYSTHPDFVWFILELRVLSATASYPTNR